MKKILLVDDEHAIKLSLRTLIEEADCGFEVVAEAKNGVEALELVERYAPDLLFVDIKMPKMDGLELLEHLSALEGEREVVIISGYDDFSYARQALRFGVKDYILKPIEPEQVIAMLHRAKERLSAAAVDMERESRWAANCRKQAAAVAERLWMLDEQALSQMLDHIDQQLREDGVSLRLTKQFYMNLTALVVHELNDRDVKGLAALSGSLIVTDGEEALAVVKDRMTEVAIHIRRSRNIGHRRTVGLAVKYIDETYRMETLSLSEVADRAGMSASHLSLLFKGEMGIGFIQYVTKKRMEQAMLLLQDPLSKASEVAYEVGYGDYSHFNKAFKKYSGLSPLEYKKRFGFY